MLLVIIGAGASYDSIPFRRPFPHPRAQLIEARPPLANELFEERPAFKAAWSRYHKCQPIIPHLQLESSGLGVEQRLSRLAAEADRYEERWKQLAALRYYLQSVIWTCENAWNTLADGVTNYKTLVDRIESRRHEVGNVLFVTFNYDRLLENALSAIGRRFNTFDAYVANPETRVVKPHGSIHWARAIGNSIPAAIEGRSPDDVANEVINRFPDVAISNEYIFLDGFPPQTIEHRALLPAIGVPLDDKSQFECPKNHLNAMEKALPEVSAVLTVGWSANEKHFLRILTRHLAKGLRTLVVSGNEEAASATVQRLVEAGTEVVAVASKLTFTESAVSEELDSFLSHCRP